MNTTTTTPPGLSGGQRPRWARRHPVIAGILGTLAALTVPIAGPARDYLYRRDVPRPGKALRDLPAGHG